MLDAAATQVYKAFQEAVEADRAQMVKNAEREQEKTRKAYGKAVAALVGAYQGMNKADAQSAWARGWPHRTTDPGPHGRVAGHVIAGGDHLDVGRVLAALPGVIPQSKDRTPKAA